LDPDRYSALNAGTGSESVSNEYGSETLFARIDIRKQSFEARAVEKWNRMPDWVRLEEKLDTFKRQLKKATAKWTK
jgi:hypothetical protein